MSHCLEALTTQHEIVFMAFFLAGLAAGFTHCLAMCGSFAACGSLCKSNSCRSNASQLSKAIALPYHLGRIISYGALGFVAALLSQQISSLSFWPKVSAAMLGLAGIVFLVSSLKSCKHKILQPFVSSRKINFFHGIFLGFLPCGAIYAALIMAAAMANPFSGMLAMMLFVLGTIPALLVASVGTHLLSQKWQGMMQRVWSAVMAFNGLSLLLMAVRTVR